MPAIPNSKFQKVTGVKGVAIFIPIVFLDADCWEDICPFPSGDVYRETKCNDESIEYRCLRYDRSSVLGKFGL